MCWTITQQKEFKEKFFEKNSGKSGILHNKTPKTDQSRGFNAHVKICMTVDPRVVDRFTDSLEAE